MIVPMYSFTTKTRIYRAYTVSNATSVALKIGEPHDFEET